MAIQARAEGTRTALVHTLDHLEETLIAVLIGAATLLIFVAVLQRYAAGTSLLYPYVGHINLGWAQEACILMFVWMAKIGAAYGVRTGIHVGVDVLVNRLPDRSRAALILFGLLCGAVFTAVVGSFGLKFVMARYAFGDMTAEMELPSWIAYLAIPIGSYLMCFRFLQVALSFWRTGHLPVHDHGHVDGLDTDLPGADSSDLFPKEIRR
ncbi:TRAP transporter small permease [Roseixanthobacter liquoris]|uniref:TRAP transporter small permease n=1 Tax=Roseixanthobacter liquoris TaxID=3119921 RepID=UPI003727284C